MARRQGYSIPAMISGIALVSFLDLLAPPSVCAQRELVVSAAASLSNVFKELGAEFERDRPRTKVTFNFAASDVLARQVVEGAPVDVFASADQESMDKAAAAKAVDTGTRFDFAANRLVLVIATDLRSVPGSLDGLRRNEISRIAMGQPATVPAGRYARAALEKAGLWQTLLDKFVYTQNVRQTLDYVARGEASAGFVYATDVPIAKGRVTVAFEVPTPNPVLYPVAITRANRNREAAGAFLDFLRSEAGRKLLLKNGFAVPTE
jgi:molybdate transport system substrate-binding protein